MGLFSGITDFLGITDGGAKKAANAQASANDGANRLIQEQYAQTRADLSPYRDYGGQALPRLRDIAMGGEIPQPTAADVNGLAYQQYASNPLGSLAQYANNPASYSEADINGPAYGRYIGGNAGQMTNDAGQSGRDQYGQDTNYLAQNYAKSPGYQFQLNEGMNAVSAEMARRGLSNSGAEQRSLYEVGQGLAARDYGDYMNRGLSQINAGRQFYAGNDAANYSRLADMGDTRFNRLRDISNTNFDRAATLEDARFNRLSSIDNTRYGRLTGQADTNYGRLADLGRFGYGAASMGGQLGESAARSRASLVQDSGAAQAGGIASGRRNQQESLGRLWGTRI